MPDFTTPKRRFDIAGFLLFGLGLVLISVGIELFGEQLVRSSLAALILISGIILLLLYIRHARHHPAPLIGLPMFKTRTFSIGIIGNIASRLGTGSVPFLMPLMLQVGFGYSALLAGCIMVPTALGSILAKSLVTRVLRSLGYRRTLVIVTGVIGLFVASFSLQSPGLPFWILLVPLFVMGMFMSMQFTSMNTITLADLTDDNASSGNSVLAVTQQLAISFGVAVSAAVLRFWQNISGGALWDFHATFLSMGIVTLLSALIFLLLKPEDGKNLIHDREKKKAKT